MVNKKGVVSQKTKKRSNNSSKKVNVGIGAYKNKVSFIKSQKIPLAYSNSTKMISPKVMYQGDGNICISNQELITEVKTLTSTQSVNDFNLLVFHVNPGLASVFPWLSSMARNYVSYQFDMLELIYVPRNTVTVPGSAMIYAEYDPSASRPENRKDFLNRKNAEEVQVFKQMDFKADQKDLHKEKTHYVRVAPPPSGQDIKLLDTCIFYFAYQGTTPATVIGDLFWRYKLKLMTPTLHIGRNQITNVESCIGTSVANSATATLPLGVMQAAQFVGDFTGVLLNTVTGGLAGNIFSTGKAILKIIQSFLPATALAAAPSSLVLRVYVPKTSTDDLSGLAIVSEDDFDIMTSFYNSYVAGTLASNFIDLTSQNSIALYDTLGSGNQRVQLWALAAPANSIIQFVSSGSSVPTGSPTLNIGDYNPIKTGLLTSPLYINLN